MKLPEALRRGTGPREDSRWTATQSCLSGPPDWFWECYAAHPFRSDTVTVYLQQCFEGISGTWRAPIVDVTERLAWGEIWHRFITGVDLDTADASGVMPGQKSAQIRTVMIKMTGHDQSDPWRDANRLIDRFLRLKPNAFELPMHAALACAHTGHYKLALDTLLILLWPLHELDRAGILKDVERYDEVEPWLPVYDRVLTALS